MTGDSPVRVRAAVAADAAPLARVHVESWRETYRGLMPDSVLDDPGLLAQREHFWEAALTDPLYARNRIALAEVDGAVVGVAMAGPALDAAGSAEDQLHLLYTLATVHGRGVGSALLEAVVSTDTTTGLWVIDPSPRAQAFYRSHGFVAEGSRIQDDHRELRMVHRPRP